MRELKFRALQKFHGTIGSDKIWITSSNLRLDADRESLNLGGVTCQYATLCQFTGLYDCTTWQELTEDERTMWTRYHMPSEWKGREIFEGDLVEHDDDGVTYEACEVTIENGIVCFTWDLPNPLYGYQNLKVIGNIHERA